MGRYFPSEEKEGGNTGHKEEIIRITDDAIKKAKAKAFHKPAKEHGNKSYRKKKKKGADPFPGKKPVDPEALERYTVNSKHEMILLYSLFANFCLLQTCTRRGGGHNKSEDKVQGQRASKERGKG